MPVGWDRTSIGRLQGGCPAIGRYRQTGVARGCWPRFSPFTGERVLWSTRATIELFRMTGLDTGSCQEAGFEPAMAARRFRAAAFPLGYSARTSRGDGIALPSAPHTSGQASHQIFPSGLLHRQGSLAGCCLDKGDGCETTRFHPDASAQLGPSLWRSASGSNRVNRVCNPVDDPSSSRFNLAGVTGADPV